MRNVFLILAGLGLGYFLYRFNTVKGIESDTESGGVLDEIADDFMGVAMTKNSTMKIGFAGLALIKDYEKLRLTSYKDQAGKPTIGWGHLIKPEEFFNEPITELEADRLLAADLVDAENAVNRYVKVALAQNQFDALVSFAFNVGRGAFGNSTLVKQLNAGRYDLVPTNLKRWVYVTQGGVKKVSSGLYKRRVAESNLWSGTVTL